MSYLTDIDIGMATGSLKSRLGCPTGLGAPDKNRAFCPALNEGRAADSVEIAAGDFNP
jgi:hypothetical protein